MEIARSVLRVPLEQIFPDDSFNCRGEIKAASVVELAEDIKERGLIQPISIKTVDPKKLRHLPKGMRDTIKFEIVSGFRRYYAHKHAELSTIEAVLRDDLSQQDAVFLNLSENVQRSDLDIVQEAEAVKRLLMLGFDEFEIGRRLGKGRGWVQVRNMLMQLPREIQIDCQLGVLKQSDIRQLFSLFNLLGDSPAITKLASTIKAKRFHGQKTNNIRVRTNKNRTKIRTRTDIFNAMDTMLDIFEPGLWSRFAAWIAGELSDEQFHAFAKIHAEDLGLDYEEFSNGS